MPGVFCGPDQVGSRTAAFANPSVKFAAEHRQAARLDLWYRSLNRAREWAFSGVVTTEADRAVEKEVRHAEPDFPSSLDASC